MKANVLTLAITLTIGIILTGSLLVPVINDAQDGQRITYNNVGLNAQLVDDEEITYSWAAGTGITIGDDVIAPNPTAFGPTVLLLTDSGFFKTNYAASNASYYEFDGSVGAGANITAATITVTPSTKTVSISDITASSTIADFSFNYDEWALVPAIQGDYVFWAPYSDSKVIHQNVNATDYSVFRSSTTWAASFKGTELTASLNSPTYTTNFNGTAVVGYEGLVDFSIGANATDNYKITISSTDYAAEAIAFERSATGVAANEGSEIISVLGIIPIMVIAALVIVAARVLFVRNE